MRKKVHKYDGGGGIGLGPMITRAASTTVNLVDSIWDTDKSLDKAEEPLEDKIEDLANTRFAGSNATLLQMSKNLPVWEDVDDSVYGGKKSILNTGIESFGAGLSTGLQGGLGWYSLIPAAADTLFNVGAELTRNSEIDRRVDSINEKGRDTSNRLLSNFSAAVTNTDATNDRWRRQNMYNTNYAAQGGLLETNGATWSTGADFINNGGIHETNPFGGVQYGIASDGLPNYVEEGEVVIDIQDNEDMGHTYAEGGNTKNKYVLSNRVAAGKEELPLLSLISKKPEQYIGKTYAEIYKDIFKKNGIEELTNRQDTKDYVNSLNSRIAKAQEATKLREQQTQLLEELRKATPEEQEMIMQQFGINPQQPMQGEYLQQEYADGGKIYIKPSKRGTFTAAATKRGMGVQEFANKVLANKEDYSPALVKKANFARNSSHWNAEGGHLFEGDGESYLDLYRPRQHQNYTYAGRAGVTLPGTPKDPSFEYWDANDPTGYNAGYYVFATNPENYTADSKLFKSLQQYYKDKGFKGELTPEMIIGTKTKPGYAIDKVGGGFHDIIAQAYVDSLQPSYSIYTDPLVAQMSKSRPWDYNFNQATATSEPATSEEENPAENPSVTEKSDMSDYSWILPAISGATVLGDALGLTNTPDYSNASRIGRAVLPPQLIGYNPNGRYVKPQLVDSNYIAARLGNQGMAGINAAKDLSGANRATALANIAEQNYLTQQAIGDALAKGQLANNAAIQQAIQANNAVDRANAQGALEADRANQATWENYVGRYANQKTREAMLRESIDQQVAANRSANWNNFLENLEGYFENQRNRDLANAQYGVYGYGWDKSGGKYTVKYKPGMTAKQKQKAYNEALKEYNALSEEDKKLYTKPSIQ